MTGSRSGRTPAARARSASQTLRSRSHVMRLDRCRSGLTPSLADHLLDGDHQALRSIEAKQMAYRCEEWSRRLTAARTAVA